ncbi:helix-turn-helix transcriptional regulator [Ruficoccus sp. ZRK36]|uniref:helix-turn-helix domain-containing protein n=1 Tax=Ruficoccus sp. ZRK36 TaxID=2866311 RepID=UPI001C7332A0|nr:helix-turn-helix domain-containing protein [Ruficoccus sp. ZRK36]
MDIKHAFGRVIARRRSQLKLSQDSLCERAGIDRSFLSEIENGKFQPTLTTIFLIARALDCFPSEIIKELEGLDPVVEP